MYVITCNTPLAQDVDEIMREIRRENPQLPRYVQRDGRKSIMVKCSDRGKAKEVKKLLDDIAPWAKIESLKLG